MKSLSAFSIVHSGVRITKTSHLAERTIASDTEPIKKRSTAMPRSTTNN